MVTEATFNIIRDEARGLRVSALHKDRFPAVVESAKDTLSKQDIIVPSDELALAIAISVVTSDTRPSWEEIRPHLLALSGLVSRCKGQEQRVQLALDCVI